MEKKLEFSADFDRALRGAEEARKPPPKKPERCLRRSVLVDRELPETSMFALRLLGATSMVNGVTK
jgi:hypothetical protein